MPTPLNSPIKAPERIEQQPAHQAGSRKRLGLPLDPLLTLAVAGLGVASVMTLGDGHARTRYLAIPTTTSTARRSTW